MLTDIPIIFVPGTSGTSLDTSERFSYSFCGDTHTFPGSLDQVVHDPVTFDYSPGQDPEGPRVWIGPEAVCTLLIETVNANRGNHYFDVLKYDEDGHNTVFPQIGPGSVFQHVNLPFDAPSIPIYESLIRFLTGAPPEGLGRPLNCGANGVYLFAYDWRADLTEQAASLGTFVDTVLARPEVQAAQVQKVVLLTHSLGGPVSRAYYLAWPAHVEQVISLGGGFGGVILPLKILVMGDTWGHGWSCGTVRVGFAEWITQALAQNWGTAYFQLPNSDLWFVDDGQGFDRSYIRDELEQRHPHTYQDSMRWIGEHCKATLTSRAEQYFSGPGAAMGNFQTGPDTIAHHRIISKGRMDTVVALRVYQDIPDPYKFAIQKKLPFNPTEWACIPRYEPVYGDGDSSVSYHGLVGRISPDENRVYVLDYDDEHIEHSALTTRPEVHLLIQKLLDGSVTNQTQVQDIFKSPHTLKELPERPAASSETETHADRWLLRVRGPAQVEIVDEHGRRVGPYLEREEDEASRRPGRMRSQRQDAEEPEADRITAGPWEVPYLFEVSIPGASYYPGNSFSSVFLTKPGTYTCRFRARTPGVVDIYWTAFAATGKLDTNYFHGIPLRPQDLAHGVFKTSETLESVDNTTLTLEEEGVRKRAILPERLDPHKSQDTHPPRTMIELKDGKVVLSATDDGGSGVLRTYYTTDARTFEEYSKPFSLPPEARTVMAFSVDRNGNWEYPWSVLPVLGLSASQFVFKATVEESKVAPQVMDISHLDPLKLTGPLKWIASTDVPWLTLDRREGQTPDQLRLSAQPGGLEPGTHTGQVVVRSPTPGVVYAERVVAIILEVKA